MTMMSVFMIMMWISRKNDEHFKNVADGDDHDDDADSDDDDSDSDDDDDDERGNRI